MEKRVAPDGVRYTEQEFLDWFGAEAGGWHWANSPDAPPPAATAAVAAGEAKATAAPAKDNDDSRSLDKRTADDGQLYTRADFLGFYGPEAGAVRWHMRDPVSRDAERRCTASAANLAELNADHARTAALKPPEMSLLDFVLTTQLLPWSRVVVASNTTTYTAWFVDYEKSTASLVDATVEPAEFLDDVPLDTLTPVDSSATVTRADCLAADGPAIVLKKLGLEPSLLQWWGAGVCRYTDCHGCEQLVSLDGNATFQRLACALMLFFRISVALPLEQQKLFKAAVFSTRFFLYDYRNDERGCGYLLLYNLSSFPSTKYALCKLQQACLLKMLEIMSTLDGHFAALRHSEVDADADAACWGSIADIETVDRGMRAEQHGMPAIPDEAAYKRITGAAEAPWYRELALMVALETVGELLDPFFQSRVMAAVAPLLNDDDDNDDAVVVLAGPPKTNNRMWGKLEQEHCRMPGYPKCYWNKDISRACIVVPEIKVAPLFRLLCSEFGEPAGVKNGFTMDKAAVRERFGYRSLMVFFAVTAPRYVTFTDVALRMEEKAKDDVWVQTCVDSHGLLGLTKWFRREHADRAVGLVCEVQILVPWGLEGRRHSHWPYKFLRQTDPTLLAEDFAKSGNRNAKEKKKEDPAPPAAVQPAPAAALAIRPPVVIRGPECFLQATSMGCGLAAAAEMIFRLNGSQTKPDMARLLRDALALDQADRSLPPKTEEDALYKSGFDGYGFEDAINHQLDGNGNRVSWVHGGRQDHTAFETLQRSSTDNPAMLVIVNSGGSQHWVCCLGTAGKLAVFADPADGCCKCLALQHVRDGFYGEPAEERRFKQNGYLGT